MISTPRGPRAALVALAGAALVIGAAGCGPANAPAPPSMKPSSTKAPSAKATSTPPSPATTIAPPATAASSPCAALEGTLGADGICKVHQATTNYTLDISVPVDYPEQQAVTDFLRHSRDEFVDFAIKTPPTERLMPYSLDIEGTSYRSGSQARGTESLVLEVSDDEGLAHEGHPDTSYQVFNYDVSARTPITLDTLFSSGTHPVDVLTPIVEPNLKKQFGDDIGPALHEAKAKAYQNFAITDDAVIVFFDESQLRVSNSGPFQLAIARDRLGPALALPPAEAAAPCASGQVGVTAEKPLSISTHRAVRLTFALTPGASPCTLTGYPGVDSGAGGPVLHAERTRNGTFGGLPDDAPTTITVSDAQQAHAIVEGDVVDTVGNQCPTYTQLLVTVPDTTETSTVPVAFDTCALAVHPIGSDL
jgi:hypothetical protein